MKTTSLFLFIIIAASSGILPTQGRGGANGLKHGEKSIPLTAYRFKNRGSENRTSENGILSSHDVILSTNDVILSSHDVLLSTNDIILSAHDVILSINDGILSSHDVILSVKNGILTYKNVLLSSENKHRNSDNKFNFTKSGTYQIQS